MYRIFFIWTVTVTVAIAVAVTAVQAFSSPRFVKATGHTGLDQVRLVADTTVTALDAGGLTPGSRYSYTFKVTNSGETTVGDFTVRSEKIVGSRAGSGLGAYSVTGGSCRVGDRVECVVADLAPGESREFRIDAKSVATRAAGDTLRIHTYLGRFKPNADGGLDYEVAAKALTCGCFVTPTTSAHAA